MKWCRCPKCGHKLFKYMDGKATLNIKCSSCKAVVTIELSENEVIFSESEA